jgi:hypothetical protein
VPDTLGFAAPSNRDGAATGQEAVILALAESPIFRDAKKK